MIVRLADSLGWDVPTFDEFGARVLIGEVYLPLHRLVAYYGNDLAGAQMPFNFALLSTLWSARSIEAKRFSNVRSRPWAEPKNLPQ